MAFDVKPKRPPVDPDALAAFAEGADTHTTAPVAPAAAPIGKVEQEGKLTESMLFRCSKATYDDFAFVYENTNVKSKQKLLESILLPEIQRRAAEIRSKQ
ncbi:MAG: hypothetical protein K0S85_302 [Pseudomonas orientalis]|nr:hypothetical protein [Pseudomonas orientalis]